MTWRCVLLVLGTLGQVLLEDHSSDVELPEDLGTATASPIADPDVASMPADAGWSRPGGAKDSTPAPSLLDAPPAAGPGGASAPYDGASFSPGPASDVWAEGSEPSESRGESIAMDDGYDPSLDALQVDDTGGASSRGPPGRHDSGGLSPPHKSYSRSSFAVPESAYGSTLSSELSVAGASAASTYHDCQGQEEQWSACEELPQCIHCVPVDCAFSEWGDWLEGTGCSGLMFRHRAIQMENNRCGLPCFGNKIESKRKPVESDDCVIPPRDCSFTQWSQWSHCLNEKDQSTRSRKVALPSRQGGEACEGSVSETKPCGSPHPHPCVLSAWQHWTACSASCGAGRYTRLRKVLREGHLSGETCDDALLETATCQLRDCESRPCRISAWSDWSFCGGSSQRMRHRQVLQSALGPRECNAALVETSGCAHMGPGECEVSAWSEWTSCSASCQQFRQRALTPSGSYPNGCMGVKLKQAMPCRAEGCRPHAHDCRFAAWCSWSPCSSAQGFGIATRSREVNPGGGLGCFGATKEMKACQVAPPEAVDCVWGSWSHWSGCSCSCGGGTKRRSRAIEMSPQNGGAPCEPLEKEEVTVCNTERCERYCENGYWSAWMHWSHCSSSCSNGYRSRRRVLDVLPNHCGSLPSGDREEFELCAQNPSCAEDADCRISEWGEWSECSCSCNGIRERNRHIAAYSRGRGRPCNNIGLKIIEHCNPTEAGRPPQGCKQRPRDCLMGRWEGWSSCTATCGAGQQQRERKIDQESMAGGRPCAGDLLVTRECSVKPCYEVVEEDCVLSAWSDWGSCSHCGGQRWRHREILRMPNYRGKPCEDYSMKEVSNCTSTCHHVRQCSWTAWSDQQCSRECGGDVFQLRSRSLQLLPVKGPADALFLGTEKSHCMGFQVSVKACPQLSCETSCIPVDCKFQEWSQWTEPSCVGLCERHRVIGRMNNDCGKPCSGSLLETKHCHTSCGHSVDCKMSSWTAWSHCHNLTHTKLRGQRYRHREVLRKPRRGGLACSGDLEQTRACATPMPEPCSFSMWEAWSICTSRCGEGTQWRERRIHAFAEDGGQQCHGQVEEVRPCHSFHSDCGGSEKLDCILGDWQAWGLCDFEGQRERRRDIVQYAQNGGASCAGSLLEIESCLAQQDCEVTEWTEWDSCSKSCGAGHTKRQRQISKFPSRGGMLCPEDLLQLKGCAESPCQAKDCEVSEWMEWSQCSATCGGGHRSRSRTVVNTRGPGGFGCYFSLAEDVACNAQTCEEGCVWGSWEAWSACSKTCGGGVTARGRVLVSVPTGGGQICNEKLMSEVAPCATDHCGELCMDGAWGEWEEWSECSSSCDGGEMFRHRDMARMANHCGQPATGLSKETRYCNLDLPCHGPKDCTLGQWSEWLACSSTCEGVTTRHRHVSEFGSGSGAFCTGSLKEVAACNPAEDEGSEDQCEQGPPVDCELTTWNAWTDCSASCGGGESQRSRALAQEARFGGFGCQQPLVEVLECGRDPCHQVHLPVDCVLGHWQSWGACNACGGERTRRRQVLTFPKNGGRECPKADMIEVKECPHRCDLEFTCSWAPWETWGDCTMTCGSGGERKRIRHLVQLPSSSYGQYGLSAGDFDRLEHGYDVSSDLQKKYHALHERSALLSGRHEQEVFFAFGLGVLCMLALLTLYARSRPELRGESDSEAALLSHSERSTAP